MIWEIAFFQFSQMLKLLEIKINLLTMVALIFISADWDKLKSETKKIDFGFIEKLLKEEKCQLTNRFLTN